MFFIYFVFYRNFDEIYHRVCFEECRLVRGQLLRQQQECQLLNPNLAEKEVQVFEMLQVRNDPLPST